MRTVHTVTSGLFLVTVGALVTACATEPQPRPVTLDPSNPAAAESAPAVLASLSTPVPAPPSPPALPPAGQAEGHQHDEVAAPPEKGSSPHEGKGAKKEATLYTCPMHPEVISDKPGRCPICGMKLVPKEPAAPGGKK